MTKFSDALLCISVLSILFTVAGVWLNVYLTYLGCVGLAISCILYFLNFSFEYYKGSDENKTTKLDAVSEQVKGLDNIDVKYFLWARQHETKQNVIWTMHRKQKMTRKDWYDLIDLVMVESKINLKDLLEIGRAHV